MMEQQVELGRWLVVDLADGSTEVVPLDVADGLTVEEGELVEGDALGAVRPYCRGEPVAATVALGYCSRWSMPGCLDCSDWYGPFATPEEALEALGELEADDVDVA